MQKDVLIYRLAYNVKLDSLHSFSKVVFFTFPKSEREKLMVKVAEILEKTNGDLISLTDIDFAGYSVESL